MFLLFLRNILIIHYLFVLELSKELGVARRTEEICPCEVGVAYELFNYWTRKPM